MFDMIDMYIRNRKYITVNAIQLKGWFQWIDMKKSEERLGGFGVVVLSINDRIEDYITDKRRLRFKIMGYDGLIR